VRRLVSAGCDSCVRVWTYNEQLRQWRQDGVALTGHSDWVRDVAWAPNLGLPMSTIASAGQDGKVYVWTERSEGGYPRVSHCWQLVVL
jgi:protein transport protein SEC13